MGSTCGIKKTTRGITVDLAALPLLTINGRLFARVRQPSRDASSVIG